MNKKKRVLFENKRKIYIFHNYYDSINEKINLWWNQDDLIYATKTANEEITRLMHIHPYMEKKIALKLLYQPNNISYDPNNF